MKVTIKNFRKYTKETVFTFDNSLNLIQGISGKGKTTIFEAVCWCLYGNLKKVVPVQTPGAKTCVQVDFNDISVCRQKKPELLFVLKNGKRYENIEAQSIINDYFGSQTIFETVNYVRQGELCRFLWSSNNDKLELIEKLAFSDDDPEHYISKVKAAISNKESENKTCEDQLTVQQANLNSLVSNYNLSIDEITNLSPSLQNTRIQEIRDRIIQEKNKLHDLNYLIQGYHLQLQKYEMYTTELNRLIGLTGERNENFNHQENLICNKIKDLEKIRDLMNEKEKLLRELEDSKKQLENLPEAQETDIELFQEKLAHLKFSEDLKKKKDTIERSLKVLHEKKNELLKKIPNDIPFHVTEEQIYQSQELENLLLKKTSIEEKINKIHISSTPQEIKTRLQETIAEIEKLKLLSNSYECPECHARLQVKNNKLVNCSVHIDGRTVTLTINDYLKQQERLVAEEKLLVMKENLENNLFDINRSIELLPKSQWSSVDLKTKKQIQDINEKIIEFEVSLGEIPNVILQDESISDIENKMNSLKKIFYQKTKLIGTIQNQKQRIDTLCNQLVSAQDPNSEIVFNKKVLEQIQICKRLYQTKPMTPEGDPNEIEETITKLEEMIPKIQASNLLMEINLLNEKMQKNKSTLEQLHKIRNHIQSLRHTAFQHVLDTINQGLSDVLQWLFEEPIQVSIDTEKQLKSKKETRPSICFNIVHKNSEFNDYQMLSGGEQARLSLAFILSCCQLSSSPIVLLDEAMAHLDLSTREVCYKTMRHHSGGKMVLCVDHNGVEGHFDDVIDL